GGVPRLLDPGRRGQHARAGGRENGALRRADDRPGIFAAEHHAPHARPVPRRAEGADLAPDAVGRRSAEGERRVAAVERAGDGGEPAYDGRVGTHFPERACPPTSSSSPPRSRIASARKSGSTASTSRPPTSSPACSSGPT